MKKDDFAGHQGVLVLKYMRTKCCTETIQAVQRTFHAKYETLGSETIGGCIDGNILYSLHLGMRADGALA